MKSNFYKSLLIFLLLPAATSSVYAQYEAVEFVDAFLQGNGASPDEVADAFLDDGSRVWISSTIDSINSTRNLSVSEYKQELEQIDQSFHRNFNTVVSLHRKAGPLATVFCSVHGSLADKETGDTIFTRSVHSYKLIENENGWKIVQLNIQNEDEAFTTGLWPDQLASKFPLEARVKEDIYSEGRPFNIDELDLPPLYPFEEDLKDKMSSAGIQEGQVAELSPFTIYIEEDGQAVLGYVSDLSADQIDRAKAFVQSMDLWVPGVLQQSNVKCKLIYSIK